MSNRQPYPIACPFCARAQEVDLWNVLDFDDEPDLRDRLVSNRINRVECSGCGRSFRIDIPLLVRHRAEGILIHCDPLVGDRTLDEVEASFAAARQELERLLPADIAPPEIHLVVDWSELIERLFLLEEGLDARLIEHIKYMLYQQNPDRLPAAAKNLLFNAQDSTDEQLCFVVQDRGTRKLEAVLNFARADYEALVNVFDSGDSLALLMEQFPGPYLSGRLRYLQDQAGES